MAGVADASAEDEPFDVPFAVCVPCWCIMHSWADPDEAGDTVSELQSTRVDQLVYKISVECQAAIIGSLTLRLGRLPQAIHNILYAADIGHYKKRGEDVKKMSRKRVSQTRRPLSQLVSNFRT